MRFVERLGGEVEIAARVAELVDHRLQLGAQARDVGRPVAQRRQPEPLERRHLVGEPRDRPLAPAPDLGERVELRDQRLTRAPKLAARDRILGRQQPRVELAQPIFEVARQRAGGLELDLATEPAEARHPQDQVVGRRSCLRRPLAERLDHPAIGARGPIEQLAELALAAQTAQLGLERRRHPLKVPAHRAHPDHRSGDRAGHQRRRPRGQEVEHIGAPEGARDQERRRGTDRAHQGRKQPPPGSDRQLAACR